MPVRAKQLIQEMPIDTGAYGDFIDPSHKGGDYTALAIGGTRKCLPLEPTRRRCAS